MVLVSKIIFFTAKIEIITLIFNKRKELFFTILANLYHPFKEKRLCASLEAFHHLLTSPLTTVFTLGGIEGVTYGEVYALVTIGRTLTTEYIGLKQSVVTQIDQRIVTPGIENIAYRKAQGQCIVSETLLLNDGSQIPKVVKQTDVAEMRFAVEFGV